MYEREREILCVFVCMCACVRVCVIQVFLFLCNVQNFLHLNLIIEEAMRLCIYSRFCNRLVTSIGNEVIKSSMRNK